MDFSQFTSNKFWYDNDERKAQKLYVALCIYISAASDFAVGLDLQNNEKLYWSTTASYYSILHSVRLIIFLATGDYPQKGGHTEIIKLFDSKNNNERFYGGWLKSLRIRDFKENSQDKFTLEQLSIYYEDSFLLPNSAILFSSIGKILEYAKKLRNNSNYDALLMAHEWHHIQVEDDFVKLSNSMSDGAKLILGISTHCFESYINNCQEINSNREKIKYLVKKYIFERLYPSINQRIKDISILNKVKESTRKLENLQYQIEINKDAGNDFYQFEQSFFMSNFREKKTLMDYFKDDVNKLEEKVKLAFTDSTKISM